MQYPIISCPQLTINNQVVDIVPNSLSYTSGYGEQTMKTQSAGGGVTSRVYSDNAESKFSLIKFRVWSTALNMKLAEEWKSKLNNNAISIGDAASDFNKTFQYAGLTKELEFNIGADKDVEVEFSSDPPV